MISPGRLKNVMFPGLLLLVATQCLAQRWPGDSIYPRLQKLRISFHVFQDGGGGNNFSANKEEDVAFLHQLEQFVNNRLGHLGKPDPVQSSAYVTDARVRVRLDTICYHTDQYAWDCSVETDGYYMRSVYIDGDTSMAFRQKYQTLPIFLGGNHPVAGGFSSNLGSKNFIAVRGYYSVYLKKNQEEAIDECGRNLLHELCHCMGLGHNFQGGIHGEQCDHCEDNGCPLEGTSNNIMDYWPNYGYALSVCQTEYIHAHLSGARGDISEILINDSCYVVPGRSMVIHTRETLTVKDTLYPHTDVYLSSGSHLVVEGYLSMPLNGKIMMEPGSALTVNRGTIGNLCGELWQGIILQIDTLEFDENHSRVELHNAKIEHAREAIVLGDSFSLTCNDSQFLNNVNGIVCRGSGDNWLSFTRTRFATTNRLNMYDLGITPGTFIHVDHIAELRLIDCSLINEPGTFTFSSDYLGDGIVCRSRVLRIWDSRIENLTRGIVFSPGDHGSLLYLFNNRFVKNQLSVLSGYDGFHSIRENLFELQKLDQRVTTGIHLITPQKFDIGENVFFSEFGSGEQIAVILENPGNETCLVEQNQIFNLAVAFMVTHSVDHDSLLLDHFQGAAMETPLPFGPLFVNNEFYKTDSWLSWETQPGYGISVGSHPASEIRMTDATTWPSGGYTWYNQFHKQCGFFGKKVELPSPGDGIWFYTNHLTLNSSLPDLTDAEHQTIQSGISDYFERYQTQLVNLSGNPAGDPYTWLDTVAEIPMIARSSKVIMGMKERGWSNEIWITEQLAALAAKYSPQDSLLSRYAHFVAKRNLTEWNRIYPGNSGPTDPDLTNWNFLQTLQPRPFFPSYFVFYQPTSFSSSPPNFTLHPIPASDWIQIHPKPGSVLGKGWQYQLLTPSGSLVASGWILDWNDLTLSLQGLTDGMYIIEIWQNERFLGSQRLIKIN